MTGRVSQFLVHGDEWRKLRALRRALVPCGRLAFHAYDPTERPWRRWNARDSRRQVAVGNGVMVSIWTEVTSLDDEMVSSSHHYRLPDGETLRSDSTLRFWSEQRIRQSVVDAGLAIERVHYVWVEWRKRSSRRWRTDLRCSAVTLWPRSLDSLSPMASICSCRQRLTNEIAEELHQNRNRASGNDLLLT